MLTERSVASSPMLTNSRHGGSVLLRRDVDGADRRTGAADEFRVILDPNDSSFWATARICEIRACKQRSHGRQALRYGDDR